MVSPPIAPRSSGPWDVREGDDIELTTRGTLRLQGRSDTGRRSRPHRPARGGGSAPADARHLLSVLPGRERAGPVHRAGRPNPIAHRPPRPVPRIPPQDSDGFGAPGCVISRAEVNGGPRRSEDGERRQEVAGGDGPGRGLRRRDGLRRALHGDLLPSLVSRPPAAPPERAVLPGPEAAEGAGFRAAAAGAGPRDRRPRRRKRPGSRTRAGGWRRRRTGACASRT